MNATPIRARATPAAGRAHVLACWVALALLASTGIARAAAQPDPVVRQILADISTERIERRIRALVGFETRHTASETESETRGIGAARRWIERELKACSVAAGGALQVQMYSFVEPAGRTLPRPTEIVNVVATLPGASAAAGRERMLVVNGHYDSVNSDFNDAAGAAPGANDDASGTAVAMELACVMARHRFDATLVFMAVAGAAQGSAAPNEEDARAFAAVREALQPIALAGGGEDLPTHQLGRHLKAAAEAWLPGFTVQLVQRSDRIMRGGDHLPFLERGYAAVRFTEPFENYRHQHQTLRTENGVVYGDLPEFVDFAFVADVARVNAAGLATLALAPPPPRNVRPVLTRPSNDTQLSWDVDPEAAGYRVVWRSTDSAAWQHSRDVGAVGSALLQAVSMDNVIFGVMAISKRGHASLASFPLPLVRR
jgi:Peptidase family M28